MMITEQMVDIQNWYIMALEQAAKFAHLPVQREMFKTDAERAKLEFFETYGEELPL